MSLMTIASFLFSVAQCAMPRMMLDTIKARLADAAPFVRHVGVHIHSLLPGQARAGLEDAPHLKNHLGTAHAAALYMLCETASGAAMAGAFAPRILSIRPVVRSAEIRYVKSARGRVDAEAVVQGHVDELLNALAARGEIDFDIHAVARVPEGVVVCDAVFHWNVKAVT